MFPPIVNNLQMQLDPVVFRKKPFQIPLGFGYIFARSQLPSLGQPMDVGVDWKGRDLKCLGENDRGGFVTDARKCLEIFGGSRHLPAMALD